MINARGLFGEDAGGGLLAPSASPDYQWLDSLKRDDPYVWEGLLKNAGLWEGFTEAPRERAIGVQARADMGPKEADWGRLAGYQIGTQDAGDTVYEALRDPSGNIVGTNSYQDGAITWEDALKGAAYVAALSTGLPMAFEGAALAAPAAAAADPISAYLTTGAVEGSTVGGAAAGGGAAGAVGAGSVASSLAAPMELGMLPTEAASAAPAAATAAAPAAATTAPAATGGLLDKLTSNPRLVAGLAGGLLGGADAGGGGYSYSGPMPTITRGGWSPTATPTYAQMPVRPALNVQPGQANSGLWRFMGGGQ